MSVARNSSSWVVALTLPALFSTSDARAEGAGFDDEIVVVAAAPGAGRKLDADLLPYAVQSADADALERKQSTDLTDYLA
ncbi:MAG: hypothetical protein AB7P42_14535, partial [Gammaproteobacteria bacterium]